MKKNIFTRSFKAITHPRLLAGYILNKNASRISDDRKYIKWKYWLTFGEKCDLDNPKTFQEKLQWIKLNDRKEIYHQMVDKYDAKKFIKEKVGEEYVIPTLGIWERFEDIDFDSLPNQFIIKNTHDSGTYFICKDKSQLDIKEVRKRLLIDERKEDYYVFSREWPYKGLKHRIIAEPLLSDEKVSYLRDFKFYCFNGEPKIFYITSDKGLGLSTKQDFFDIKGNHIEIQDKCYPNNPIKCPDLPLNLDKMVAFCKILAKDTLHIRVDFYEVNGMLYLGEFTFFEGGGWCKFTPEKYNRILGDWIKLPIDN